jgi:hypothetical protein
MSQEESWNAQKMVIQRDEKIVKLEEEIRQLPKANVQLKEDKEIAEHNKENKYSHMEAILHKYGIIIDDKRKQILIIRIF